MNKQPNLCASCHKRPARPYSDICSTCDYKIRVEFTRTLPRDDQDWEFSICEECGRSLDSGGVCRNTSCGASPDCGKDWE